MPNVELCVPQNLTTFRLVPFGTVFPVSGAVGAPAAM